MPSVAAGFSGRVEAWATAVPLRRVCVLLHAELLQSVDRCLHECSALVLLGYVDTIQQERHRKSVNAADGIAVYNLGTNCQRIAGRRKKRRAWGTVSYTHLR